MIRRAAGEPAALRLSTGARGRLLRTHGRSPRAKQRIRLDVTPRGAWPERRRVGFDRGGETIVGLVEAIFTEAIPIGSAISLPDPNALDARRLAGQA